MRPLALSILLLLGLATQLHAEPSGSSGVPPALPPAARSPALPTDLAPRARLLGVARAGARLVAVGERGHVILSDDEGQRWRQAAAVPARATLTSVAFVGLDEGWAVGHDAVILHTSDAGERWERQFCRRADEGPLLSVWFEDELHGFAAGAYSLLLETRDGGLQWVRRPAPGGAQSDAHLNQIFGSVQSGLFIAAEAGQLFRSLDAGRSWQSLTLPYRGSLWGGLALPEGVLLVFGMRGHVLRSEDAGQSWRRAESGTRESLSGGFARSGGEITLVGLGGSVLRSNDAGKHFRVRIRPDRQALAAAAAGPGSLILLFGDTGFDRIDW